MYRRYVKPALDACAAFSALCALSPVMLLLCLAGAVCMRGNPFFTQERVGKNEALFRLLKFRSMTEEKDAAGRLLPDAMRLNRYGRFIRKTSLDELPQLVNILKGEMSFVGPRPLLPEYLPYYTARERLRHTVRPGLTGLAQIHGRNDIDSWEDRLAYDIAYAERCTFIGDLCILARTAAGVFRGKGVISGEATKAGRLDEARGGDHGNRDQTILLE